MERIERKNYNCPRYQQIVAVTVLTDICERHTSEAEYHATSSRFRDCTGALGCGVAEMRFKTKKVYPGIHDCPANIQMNNTGKLKN